MKKFITVKQFFNETKEDLNLSILCAKNSLRNKISNYHIQKPGLALAGYLENIKSETVSILGNTETSYLKTLPAGKCNDSLRKLLKLRLACIIISNSNPPPCDLLGIASKTNTPVMCSTINSTILISRLLNFLEEKLAESITLHGVLVDVFGVGVLLLGKSGVGKSEIVLDLVEKGHRLVSDDVVVIKKTGEMTLLGSSPESIRHHMEIRGLGIINIKDLFGVTSIRDSKRIEIVIELEEWELESQYERLGLDTLYADILGIKIPKILMPVAPGRNMSMIIEIAARNYLLKKMGYNPAEELNRKLLNKIIEEEKSLTADSKRRNSKQNKEN
ncbi:MAG: HPr(Ser) kinase/phosphatase [Candidatus Schekmanbacteria bacterium]|nr:HPr(Ser) kinase/phosphatase [Candidatus Schekmanbacteria bacterium]